MTLDISAREANVRDSVKRYFIENLYTTENIELLFDERLSTPNVRDKDVNRWVSVNFGSLLRSAVSIIQVELFCCTRKDAEGFRLAQLTDTVIGYLSDEATTDGFKRIPFYRSKATGAWDLIGSLLVTGLVESRQMDTEGGVKFKILTLTLKFMSKI